MGGGALPFNIGGTADSSSQISKDKTNYWDQQKYQPTPVQQYGEGSLMNMLRGYMSGGGQGQLVSASRGPTLTSQQQQLLEGQTSQFMKGLQGTLDQWRKGAMSQAQQSAIRRGIPLSDIARGQEANVDAQYLQQLAQGWNQAKMAESQAKLDYPMQNLQYLLAANQPYMGLLGQLGMMRQPDISKTGESMTKGQKHQLDLGFGMGFGGGGGGGGGGLTG